MADISVTTHIDTISLLRQVRDPKFWKFAATEWHRLYRNYIPKDTGALENTVVITSAESEGSITHTQPYAESVYLHNRRYRKDKHPLATARWDEAAAPTQKPKLIKSMQAYIDSGRLKFE